MLKGRVSFPQTAGQNTRQRKEARTKTSIPKSVLPSLLSKLCAQIPGENLVPGIFSLQNSDGQSSQPWTRSCPGAIAGAEAVAGAGAGGDDSGTVK